VGSPEYLKMEYDSGSIFFFKSSLTLQIDE